MTDDQARQLHHRSTKGEKLTSEEQGELEKWYEEQDHAESLELGLTQADSNLGELQRQTGNVTTQLIAATTRLQQLVEENDTLRREIGILRQHLAKTSSFQVA